MSALLMAQETPTPALIEQLRGLLAKATPGPWMLSKVGASVYVLREVIRFDGSTGKARTRICFEHDGNSNQRLSDFSLIVAAVNALPSLLTSLESAQARVAEMEGALEPFARLAGPINGEEGRPTYLEAISGPNGTDELLLSTYVGDGTRTEVLDAEDFRRARAALKSPLLDGGGGVMADDRAELEIQTGFREEDLP